MKTFEEILDQDLTIDYLKARIQGGSLKPILLYGPEGCGKMLLAKALAFELNRGSLEDETLKAMIDRGTHPDIRVFSKGENASFKIDEVRGAIDFAYQPKSMGLIRVLIFEDIHYFPGHLQSDALLKTVEDGLEDTLFVFTVKDLDSVFPTLRSRTDQVRCSPLSISTLQSLLPQSYPEASRSISAKLSKGSYSKALEWLEKPNDEASAGLSLISTGKVLWEALSQKDVERVLDLVAEVPKEQLGLLIEVLSGQVTDVLLIEEGLDPETFPEDLEALSVIGSAMNRKAFKAFEILKDLALLGDKKGLDMQHQVQARLLKLMREVCYG